MVEILASMTRNGLVENIIRGSLVVINHQGHIKGYCGDCHQLAYLRSAAKPLIAVTLIESGAAAALGLTEAEVAVACGSHIGADEHLEAVFGLLAKSNFAEEDLIAGPVLSLDRKLHEARIRDQVAPRKAYHNCSGKQAAMLAICRYKKWDSVGYQYSDHPLQQYLLQTIADFCDLMPQDIILGIDGCGVPVHGMPLYQMALAYLKLSNNGFLPEPRQRAVTQVLDALGAYPSMISGRGQFCTELLQVTQGRIIGKLGADGLYLAAERNGGWSLALKVEHGASSLVPAIVVCALKQLNLLAEDEQQALSRFAVKPVKATTGEQVGEQKAEFFLKKGL